jgi:hypothetical protein
MGNNPTGSNGISGFVYKKNAEKSQRFFPYFVVVLNYKITHEDAKWTLTDIA